MNCAHCRGPLSGYFEITRWNNMRENKGSVRVCSIRCVISWAYNYGAVRVRQGANAVRDTIKQIADTLKGASR